jgi:hypothetical protein
MVDSLIGISLYPAADRADFEGLRIRRNELRVSRWQGPLSDVGALGISQVRDDTGVFTYRAILENSLIEGNTFIDDEPAAQVDRASFLWRCPSLARRTGTRTWW